MAVRHRLSMWPGSFLIRGICTSVRRCVASGSQPTISIEITELPGDGHELQVVASCSVTFRIDVCIMIDNYINIDYD